MAVPTVAATLRPTNGGLFDWYVSRCPTCRRTSQTVPAYPALSKGKRPADFLGEQKLGCGCTVNVTAAPKKLPGAPPRKLSETGSGPADVPSALPGSRAPSSITTKGPFDMTVELRVRDMLDRMNEYRGQGVELQEAARRMRVDFGLLEEGGDPDVVELVEDGGSGRLLSLDMTGESNLRESTGSRSQGVGTMDESSRQTAVDREAERLRNVDRELATAFQELGLSEGAANMAAQGRTVSPRAATDEEIREAARDIVDERIRLDDRAEGFRRNEPPAATEADVVAAFQQMGLSESAAKAAARGRK